MKLFYREEGEGFPVIILHGLFGMSDNWMTVAKKLADNYRVIVADLRNHGNSPRSETWNYKVMAEDINELSENTGAEKFHLIGHSMGGKVAMEFAQKFPEKLEKLVVVDIGPKAYPVHHQHIIDALYKVDVENIKSRQDAEKALETELRDWGVRQFLLKNLARNRGGYQWKFNLDIINRHIENVGAATDRKEVETPTLFIRGERSDYIRSEDGQAIRQQFKNSTIVSIKESGHWVHAEKPEEFLTTVIKFFEYQPSI